MYEKERVKKDWFPLSSKAYKLVTLQMLPTAIRHNAPFHSEGSSWVVSTLAIVQKRKQWICLTLWWFFVTLEMAFFRSCKNQLSGWKFPHVINRSFRIQKLSLPGMVNHVNHEGSSCWFWNSYPFLHMTESQRGSAITHGSLVRFIFHTFSLIPLTCSSVERLDGLALIQEIEEIDSNICQVLDIPITTTYTLSLSPITPRINQKKNLPVDSWTFLWISSSDLMVEEKECLLGLSLPWSILLYSSFQQRHKKPSHGPKTPPSHLLRNIFSRSRLTPQNLHQTKSLQMAITKWA